jgi:hypothetical protein
MFETIFGVTLARASETARSGFAWQWRLTCGYNTRKAVE